MALSNPCADGTCVDVERTENGVVLTSTIPENTDVLTVTHGEWDAFLDQVKAGLWDHTATRHAVPV